MNKLYNSGDLAFLKKKKDINLGISISLFLLAIISLVLFVIFATYQTRKPLTVISSVVTALFLISGIYFISRFAFYHRIYNEYLTLMNTETKTSYLVFSDVSINPITLQDKSKVYEVRFTNNTGNIVLYLSYIFDIDIFELNHRYKIETVYDYIVGYQDEN